MGEIVSLGQFISGRRELMHLTQEALAERLSVSKSAVAKWETNRGVPDRDNLKKLSEVIEVPLNDLYRFIDGGYESKVSRELNITADIIRALESYGYKVVPNDASEFQSKD